LEQHSTYFGQSVRPSSWVAAC